MPEPYEPVANEIEVIPATGEIVNLNDVFEVARAYRTVTDLERDLKQTKDLLRDALVFRSTAEGKNTMHLEGLGKVEIRRGTEIVWDAWALKADLLEAGMSRERVAEIVVETVDARVSAVEAKKAAAANPAYAEIVARHRRDFPKKPTVNVP
jgi:hypothetical protein